MRYEENWEYILQKIKWRNIECSGQKTCKEWMIKYTKTSLPLYTEKEKALAVQRRDGKLTDES